MSNFPVHNGSWTDWSYGAVLGRYVTLSIRDTLYVLGATSVLVTYVTGCVWSMYAFFAHQRLSAANEGDDIITFQHRSIYRNDSTATAAALDAFWVYWNWKPWKLWWPPHPRARKRGRRVGLRTCGLIVPAFIIFSCFSIAGIFVTRIATHAYDVNTVLVANGSELGHCGISLFDNSVEAVPDFDIKASSDTRAALSYARSCYSPQSGTINSVACSLFVKTKLNYSTNGAPCPFGDVNRPFEESVCASNGNNAAYSLRTDLLDSHNDFGVNARASDRVQMVKELTCSPLVNDGFHSLGPSHGAESGGNISITNYNYGGASNIQNYTYQYNSADIYDNVPFEVFTLLHNDTGPAPWIPVSNISRPGSDVTIIFIAPNSIKFRTKVQDPVFQTTYNDTILSNTGQRFDVFNPDFPVSVVGCTEQYQICNPNLESNVCTPSSGQAALSGLIESLYLNEAQLVTAYRMIYMIVDGTTYSSVNGIGPDALQIWNEVYNFIAPGVPDNQWQIEVRGWFETTLAKWQAFMVGYSRNKDSLGPHGHIGFPVSNSSLQQQWMHQCGNQKISNLGTYQNISVFGFAFTWTVSWLLMIFSWSLKYCVKQKRKWTKRRDQEGPTARRVAWNIDGKFQQQRVAMTTVGYRKLMGGEDDVPFLEEEDKQPLPFFTGEQQINGREQPDTIYLSRAHEEEMKDLGTGRAASPESPLTHVSEGAEQAETLRPSNLTQYDDQRATNKGSSNSSTLSASISDLNRRETLPSIRHSLTPNIPRRDESVEVDSPMLSEVSPINDTHAFQQEPAEHDPAKVSLLADIGEPYHDSPAQPQVIGESVQEHHGSHVTA